jgi:hypothetical protein
MKIKLLFSITFLIIILCKKENITNSNKNENTLNISNYEMDKLMSCSYIITLKTQEDKDLIDSVKKKLNTTQQEKISAKIYTDMFEKCVNTIKEESVSKIFKNLKLVIEPEYSEEVRKLVEIDYTIYNNNQNLNLTLNQQILVYKFQKVREIFQKKKAENPKEDIENERGEENDDFTSNTYDITKMPKYINAILFIIVFGLLFFGTYFLLKKLTYKPEKKKKKKN